MNFVTRLASRVDISYPLPIDAEPAWFQSGPTWCCEIPMPDLPESHIVAPSLSMLDVSAAYTFSIQANGVPPVSLQQVPGETDTHRASGGSEAHFSTHIDCWHTHCPLQNVLVSVRVISETPPDDALLTVSCRALLANVECSLSTEVLLPRPDPISQMEAEQQIRQRICSPTALTMCLSAIVDNPPWQEITAKCLDPVTRAYGSWPVAVRAANDYGVHGAVELLFDWHSVHDTLASGVPIVCSINFKKGELADAPLQHTSGHLVLLYGYNKKHVWVLDPAGNTKNEVPKRYDLEQFSKAWLHQRGAAYIFCRDAYPLPH